MKNVIENVREVLFVDNGVWEYDRFKLVENEEGVFFIDLECDEEDSEMVKLEKFDNLDNLIKEGIELGYFEEGSKDYFYYDFELDMEIFEWMEI
jgi:hypothetical protein